MARSDLTRRGVRDGPVTETVDVSAVRRLTDQGGPHDGELISCIVGDSRARPNGPLFENHEGVVSQPGLTYSVTVDEPGSYLSYCTPRGAPFEVTAFRGNTVYNEFEMRGAVIVRDE